jgi:hypothetical protein
VIERGGEELACAAEPGSEPRLGHGAVQAHFEGAWWAGSSAEAGRQLGFVEVVTASDEYSEFVAGVDARSVTWIGHRRSSVNRTPVVVPEASECTYASCRELPFR